MIVLLINKGVLAMKPLIGITASLDGSTIRLQRDNVRAVEQAGGDNYERYVLTHCSEHK